MPLPTYGYQCTQCSHEFSVFQNMKDDPVRVCPECAGSVKRLLYPVGVVFKGSGWYVNDSRKPDPAESKAEKSESSESKAESKPTDKAAADGGSTGTAGSDSSTSGKSSGGETKAAAGSSASS